VGGLVGTNSGTITSCTSSGSVTGGSFVGGLVGANTYGVIQTCYSSGMVFCGERSGGLVGQNNCGTVISCYSSSTVISSETSIGGLVGHNYGTISFCYSTGTISGNFNIGGLVGWNDNGAITSCYSICSVYGQNAGGLIGTGNSNKGIVVTSFWDIQTSGQINSIGGVGLSTIAMKASETYLRAGWDFKGEIVNGIQDTWTMPINGGYPILRWQISGMSGPENDDMSGAIEIHTGDSVAGSSEGATGIDLTQNGYNDWRDLWYSFMPDEGGKYSITVQGSFDTTLGVFDSVGREVAFNDDYFGGKTMVILKAGAGKQYYLRVAGYDGQAGNFTLTIEKGAIQMIQGDLNYDGKVDLIDLSLMAQNWLMGV
jgi:hypothetical protein